MLYFDLLTRPRMSFQGDAPGRRWHIPMTVMRGNRVGGNWQMKWDELKISHATLIDWCTGREWPVNCMTFISAWWRLNIRFQRSSGRELSYNPVKTKVKCQLSCKQLEWRCGRENHTLPKGLSGALIELGSRGERERHNVAGHKFGVKILQFLFGLQLPLSGKTWVTLFEPLQ